MAQCSRCRASGLEWESHGNKWVLHTLGGRKHECDPAKVKDSETPTRKFKGKQRER